MSVIGYIKQLFGLSGEGEEMCLAIVDEETGELCGNDVHGHGWVDNDGETQEVKYCKDHYPSKAIPWDFSRWGTVRFRDPETGREVELE